MNGAALLFGLGALGFLFQRDPRAPFGAAVLEAARRSLGVHETAPNSGPEIDKWIRELGLTPPAQWCAVAVTHWMRVASLQLGVAMPVRGAAGAKALLGQFQGASRALTADQARREVLSSGTVLVWDRATPMGSSFAGHTAIVDVDNGETWLTIEGNTLENDVRRVVRRKDDPRLMGAGLVD